MVTFLVCSIAVLLIARFVNLSTQFNRMIKK